MFRYLPTNRLFPLAFAILLILLFIAALPFVFHHFTTEHYKPSMYSNVRSISGKNVALVLGAGLEPNGSPSYILHDRLETSAKLYKAKKVKKIVVSGDNRFKNYSEPDAMKAALVKMGVPANVIQPDFAGRRTYDSCWRMNHIFSQTDIIIVTQSFHMTRSLFLCNHLGVKSIGMIADKPRYSAADWNWWTFRDKLSILKAYFDIYIWQPYVVPGKTIELFKVSTGPITVAAAGDIACADEKETDTECKQQQTATLIQRLNPQAVFALGDLQYGGAGPEMFDKYYDKSWGMFKEKTYPVLGNHEYETGEAAGYFDYFKDRAGEKGKGYYSFNLGTWHIIALNSNCYAIGGCDTNSSQYRWLEQDLRQNVTKCTLAMWHHPVKSSGQHGANPVMQPTWDLLAKHNVDVVLNGHDHIYERFQVEDGIRQLTVGTGGRNLYAMPQMAAGSEVRNNETFGVLKLTLEEKKYSWEFVPIEGKTFSDKGTGSCQ